MSDVTGVELDDDSVAAINDFLDNALSPQRRDEVAAKIAADSDWKRTHDELVQTRQLMAQMPKAVAPPSFATDVTSTIHSRSAGRFFARRSFGDRVPFGVLAAITAIGLAIIGYLLWSSDTGSLRSRPQPEPVRHSQPLQHGE